MYRIATFIVLLLPFGGGPEGVAQEAPAAIVLRAAPGPETGADTPAVGALLPVGEIAGSPGTSRLTLLLYDGRVVDVEPGYEVPPPGVEADPAFRVTRAHLSAPDPEAPVADPDEAGRDPGERGPLPVRPTGGHQVRSITPRMVWHAFEGAEGYRLRLTVSEEEVLTLEAGADTVYTIPAEAALVPGASFEWAVAAMPGEAMGPPATFSIASRELLDEVAEALGRMRAMGLDPEENGLLVAAALFRSLRLPYDALAALEALQALGDPWSPDLVRFHDRVRTGL